MDPEYDSGEIRECRTLPQFSLPPRTGAPGKLRSHGKQGGMRLLRRAKILLHAEMNLHFTTFEPASSTLSEFRWLGNLGHAKQIAVKPASRIFPARRHGKLNMIDRKERASDHVGVLGLILYRTPEVRGPASALLESNVDRRTHGRRLPSQFCDHCPHRSR